jgi:hypothetical protein
MTNPPEVPEPPLEPVLPDSDPRTLLVQRVRAALMVLPGFFEFGTIAMRIELKGWYLTSSSSTATAAIPSS